MRIRDWSSDVCSSDLTESRLSTRQRPLAAFDEVEEVAHVCAVVGHAGELLPGSGEAAVGDVHGAVGALDRGDAVAVEAAALEPLAVDPARAAVVVGGDQQVRRHVAVDQSAHADEGVRADAAELVDAGEAAYDHPVAELQVPGEGGVVGEQDRKSTRLNSSH